MSSPDAIRARSQLPAVDEPLVAPETRYEVLDGGLVHVPPAYEPHGSRHSKVSALVEAHVAPEFDVASDMLTRTSETDDVAPDVSVFPYARDPETGGRQIEHLAFDIVSTESLGHAGQKAAKLVARGVRRVFAIDVERERALEWSRSRGTWSLLAPSGHIEDLALAVPLPIEALVHAAKADDAMARALLAKRNPVLEATRAEDRVMARAGKGLRPARRARHARRIAGFRGSSTDSRGARSRSARPMDRSGHDLHEPRAGVCRTLIFGFLCPGGDVVSTR